MHEAIALPTDPQPLPLIANFLYLQEKEQLANTLGFKA